MSGTEDAVIESAAPPEIQSKAEKMGWIPPARFRGNPETFIDAEEFIERGEQILPIVRSQNQKLQAEVEQLRGGYAETQAALKRAEKALEEINERHTVATQKAVEQAHKDLKGKLAAALEAGDHAAVAEITGLMVDLKAAQEPAPATKKEEEPPAASTPAIPDDLKEWNKANPWYGTDRRKTALALGIAQELRDSGVTLVGVDFYEKVREGVEEVFGAATPPAGKVEGARGSGAGAGGPAARGGKGYASLPAEARAACDADAKNFVGEGKRYKTVAEWQKRYAELYFED